MSTNRAPRRLMTVPEVAEYLGLTPLTVKRRIADGSFPAVRIPGTRAVRIDADALDAAIDATSTGGGPR